MGVRLERFTDPADAARAALQPGSRVLGGGTLLIRHANMGDASIESWVRLENPAAHTITFDGEGAILGGRVSMRRIIEESRLSWLAPAASAVGSPAIRAMATVAGNLHAPSPYGDLAVALLAADAVIALATPDGEAEVPIEAFLAERSGRFAHAVISTIRMPVPEQGSFHFYKATRRRPNGLAVVTIAARLGNSPRIALGAVAPYPVRAPRAEAELARGVTPDSIAASAAAILDGLDPPDDAIASGWYRRAVLPVHLRRMLERAGAST
jgi:CO/xanthine dehydrogenase FAD-binding subunit